MKSYPLWVGSLVPRGFVLFSLSSRNTKNTDVSKQWRNHTLFPSFPALCTNTGLYLLKWKYLFLFYIEDFHLLNISKFIITLYSQRKRCFFSCTLQFCLTYSETLNKEYIGRNYQMSSWQLFNEFYTILLKISVFAKINKYPWICGNSFKDLHIII